MGKAEVMQKLREIPGILPAGPQRETLPFSLVKGGVPSAGMVEVSGLPGAGKTELALRFLAENPNLRGVWVEEKPMIFPPAFEGLGLDLSRILFVEAGAWAGWACLEAVRSGLFGFVGFNMANPGENLLRRLQIAAEQARSSLWIFGEEPLREGGWALSLHLRVKRSQKLHSPDPLRIENGTDHLPLLSRPHAAGTAG